MCTGLPTSPSAEDEFLAERRRRLVRNAVAALPGRCPQLIAALAEDPPPTYQEISERLGMPRGSIGPTRSRCLACLRALLHAERYP
ncbi:sigma-70 family RNA polymerase sigma factor [Streptomyces kaniharaensis]|uniref:Sigma-70 family RNA polymerase sigma factor n=1 Tax=Streptomyces kaniharaensis TaxID=212423 RepID=A0A6N7KMS6_9ACTN|nr:sigma-70 family RNA polymerase sigma factor [Streptomyces kaniharaensis]MQS11454.1 sigma-70 family RNA polymerase sigma factor [Streptomyces kaniharaensis]